MKFQYCLWDKLKELEKLQSSQMINLAKLLAHLFLEKGLPISALKVRGLQHQNWNENFQIDIFFLYVFR